ncbi:competence protein CoiA [Lederbergia citrea]|uniref:Competence protein CoiA n=1 Tax=Lederbergia citrea TaxID=2833581 RepID=A0A942Z1C2_9BACI|nr:competence protein CoiA family protein [Lederbergia citrea]MBS4177399.1 hypothetical protein [Lederbergia citrea]MBS4204077.1 hypothetical protein [Lederbergia citrea]MBS4221338.1 hypothetical protein [Lederbergia citrea]
MIKKGSDLLLTALNEEGQSLSLLSSISEKNVNKTLRSQQFFCPICREPLILRAGEIRIPHFAHKKNSDCTSAFSEPESIQHLQGKKYLYDYFMKQGLTVELEYYLPNIKQRPDLLVKNGTELFAIEYQCSILSRTLLQTRTEGYLKVGISPIWIIGGLPFQKKQNDIFKISDFHWSLAKRRDGFNMSLLSFHTEMKRFYLLSEISPLSSRKIFATLSSKHVNDANLPLQIPVGPRRSKQTMWLPEKRRWLKNKVHYGNIVDDPFLKAIYVSGNNPFLLSPIIGLPVPNMEYFQSHPLEWQYFIYQDCLSNLSIGQRISLKYIYQKLRIRMKASFLLERIFPLEIEGNWEYAVKDYFSLMTELEYFIKIGEDLFEMIKIITMPKTIEEALKMEEAFDKKLVLSIRKTTRTSNGCIFFGI